MILEKEQMVSDVRGGADGDNVNGRRRCVVRSLKLYREFQRRKK